MEQLASLGSVTVKELMVAGHLVAGLARSAAGAARWRPSGRGRAGGALWAVSVGAADAPERWLGEAESLDGGAVPPGFSLPVARLFERLAQRPSGAR